MFSHLRKEFRSKYQTNLLSVAHIGNNPWHHFWSLNFDWNWDWAIVSSESWMFRNVCDSVKTLWFECYQSDCKSVNKACPAHLSDLFVLETSSINTQQSISFQISVKIVTAVRWMFWKWKWWSKEVWGNPGDHLVTSLGQLGDPFVTTWWRS